ncbi:MAG: hypothetical protein MJZ68_08360 [archaeon]|nr:hypothetical protein [archaeon]
MTFTFTEPQIQRLREYGDDPRNTAEFESEAERDKAFSKLMSKLDRANEDGIRDFIVNPRHHRLMELELRLSEALIAEGFTEVKTPLFVSKAALAKMTITEDHPLYQQVFWIDSKRALRPMHAPNLYYVMRKLRDHTDGPVKIFEIGSCFRAESHSNDHLEEFTMLNLVDMGPQGDTNEKIRHYIDLVMKTVGLDYELVDEESDVYKQTIDVEVDGEEVCSAAIGPHVLDPAHDVHEPWCGAGFGLERLLMMKDGDGSVKKTGRSLSYLNGFKIN